MPADVAIWSGEDAIHDVLAPRLIALGADMARVRFVKRVIEPEGMRPFDPAHDMTSLQEALKSSGARLLILDPIVSAVAGDSHENAKVRRALQPVVDLAEALNCAVLGVSHFSKGTAGRDPVERVTGSVAFGALPRLVFAAAKLPEEEGAGRIFVRSKSNIGPSGGGFGYALERCEIAGDIATSKLLWKGPLEGSARALLAQVEVADGGELTGIADAAVWLRDILTEGPVKAQEVLQQADQQGFHKRTVQHAKDRIGARSKREGFGKGSHVVWELPVPTPIDTIDDKPKRMSPMASMGKSVIYGGIPERRGDGPLTSDAEVI
jgi:hypothetical protein